MIINSPKNAINDSYKSDIKFSYSNSKKVELNIQFYLQTTIK